jgi:hypothetical protein
MDSENFNPRDILVEDIVIKSAGSHLYRIGLSLFPKGSKKRNKFHNPLFVFIFQFLITIRYVIPLLLSDGNETLLLLSGNIFQFLNMTTHGCITAIFLNLIALISQLHHFYYYLYDIKPSYLKPFEMMSGLRSPKSIGLTDKKVIQEFMKRQRLLLKIFEIFTGRVLLVTVFSIIFPIYCFNCSIVEVIVIGIPHSILWAFAGYTTFNIIFWQVMYFYIICYYLRSKIRVINTKLEAKIKNKSRKYCFELIQTMNSLQKIYEEIEEYNDNYWSNFLFLIWISFTLLINTMLYLIIYGKMNLFQRVLFSYIGAQFIAIVLLILRISSSVNFEAKKTYKLLNSLIIFKARSRNIQFYRFKIKV